MVTYMQCDISQLKRNPSKTSETGSSMNCVQNIVDIYNSYINTIFNSNYN